MKSVTVSGVGLALIGVAQAGVITARQGSFRFECNGQQYPDTGDCNDLFNTFTDGTQTYTKPSGVTANGQVFNLGDSSNCQVEIFWQDNSYVVTGNQIFNAINGVSTTCFPSGTGGTAVDLGGRYTIGVRNNPTYDPPAKRSVSKLIPMGRRGDHMKRADGDESFTYGIHTTYAKPQNFKHNIGPGLPGGSTWEWSEEKSVTDSVSFSSSVSAGIEGILSASLSTEISSSTTTTSGQASTITINCEDNEFGQVYFQAYAETWQGVLQPSGQQLIVTKPMAKDGVTEGFYSYDCIPK
ncbi:hypothetical protein IAQ61_000533 [Plenodomus lingam]|uniref:uncharacterized protein n=1 Tax=Leptosphaeria maculans TaxID=5022 RepID=UPI00331A95E0|nr:hypothetical protein IAQ61_000533 [Plenodomus lingam]